MSSFNTLGADTLANFWDNPIPQSFTVTPWQVQLAKLIYKDTADPKLKSLGGAQGWNVVFMDKLKKLSLDHLLPGANRWVYMNANGPSTNDINKSFFNNIGKVKDSKDSLDKILLVAGLIAIAMIVGNLAPILGSFKKK